MVASPGPGELHWRRIDGDEVGTAADRTGEISSIRSGKKGGEGDAGQVSEGRAGGRPRRSPYPQGGHGNMLEQLGHGMAPGRHGATVRR